MPNCWPAELVTNTVQLVNEIAQRWGFLRERGRTCVWFELLA
jgi:hypothetical protein